MIDSVAVLVALLRKITPMESLSQKRWSQLQQTAEKGDPEALWEVGYWTEFGAMDASGEVLVAPSPRAALLWYQLSAEAGNSSSQHALSRLLSTGEDVDRDLPLAIRWAKKAIAQGDASAAFNLATIYRDIQKHTMAFRWYQHASAMGDADAFLEIGLCHLFGLGTTQNHDAAKSSFKRLLAAEGIRGSQRAKENAHYWLAIAHLFCGKHTRRSLLTARIQLEMANTDGDHEQANDLLNFIGKTKYLGL